MNFSSSHGRVPYRGMLITEIRRQGMSFWQRTWGKSALGISQAFSLHPLSLLRRPKPIRYPPARLACKEDANC
jgi:hypothetical protein